MENDEKIIQVDNLKYVEPQQSANTLFKFMKKLEYLKLIIENGAIIPRYNIEIIDYLGLQIIDEIAFPMSCFCDINLTKLSLHAERYGYYGIGLKKEYLYKNIDIEPIHYVNSKSNEINDFREAFSIALKESEQSEQALANYLLTSLLYMKPILENITVKDLDLYKSYIEHYSIKDVVVGSIFTGNITNETVHFSNKNELFYNSIKDEDIIISELSKICNVYRRSTDVTNYYKMN